MPNPPTGIVSRIRETARERLGDLESSVAERKAAIAILGKGLADRPEDRDRLAKMLGPQEPADTQLAAIEALTATIQNQDHAGVEKIWSHWSEFSPSIRESALDALMNRPAAASALLTAVEEGKLVAGELGALRRQRLLEHPDLIIRKRAVKSLNSSGQGQTGSNRQSVVDAYRGKMPREGDPIRGSAAFDRVCASCHVFGGQGFEVGPDLAALTDRSTEALLTAILDPNRDVDARYNAYSVELKDGRVLTGLVAAETGGSLTLKQQHGKTEAVPRGEIEQIKNSGKSLMPEGVEQDLEPADVADVIAYLQQGGATSKTFEGNHPELVKPQDDGSIRLDAARAAIYGPSLIFEQELSNLGYWHNLEDRAEWTFEVDQSGVYTVSIEWACAEESAGNLLVVQCEGQTIRRSIGGTGGWANYRTIFLGELKLEKGKHQLAIKAGGPIQGALLDLRSLILTPRGAIAVPKE